jgi:hypothetical protein
VALLKRLGLALAISFPVGLLLAFVAGPSNLPIQAFAMSGLIASISCGFVMGEDLRMRGKGRRLPTAILTLGAGVLAFFWGLVAPPVIGQSESHILFPGVLLVGVFAGWFGKGRSF